LNSVVRVAPHETFELHELINFKNICATKASSMSALVNDDELKSIMQQDLSSSQDQIRELMSLLQLSEYAPKS
jgi:similar to spore coat protein